MFGARGVSLRLGGVNLSDLSNLGSANAAHRAAHHQQLQRHHSRTKSSGGGGASVGGVSPTSTTSATGSKLQNLRKSLMEPKKKTRIVIKKTLDRTTFWSVCRALVFGTLLIALGCAMSTIGYYKEYFATETVQSGNDTITFINYSTRTQFESLSYIGPCIMGCGMFVLMIACVMTLEGRDLNTQIYSQRLTRKSSSRRSAKSRTEPDDGNLTEQTGPTDEQRRLTDYDKPPSKNGAHSNEGDTNKSDGNASKNVDEGGGKINECFTKDDAKLQHAQHEPDSGPHSTTTTTLTWSRTGGPRCEPLPEPGTATAVDDNSTAVAKYISASSLDALAKKSNTRVLLQRFLEDQSRLVDDRMKRMRSRQKAQNDVELKKQSASLDVDGSEKLVEIHRFIKSDDYPRTNYNVVAEVHHSGDAQSPLNQKQWTGVDAHVHRKVAPMASSEIFCSPISFTPDSSNNNGVAQSYSNGRPTPNSYLSAVYSPITPRQKLSSKGSQLSVNSYTTVKSHISAASAGGYSNSDVYTTALNDPTSSGSCSDFINGNNRLDSESSDVFWNKQPYFANNPQLFVMNRVYRPNGNELIGDLQYTSENMLPLPTMTETAGAGAVDPAVRVGATDDESLSSLSYDLPISNPDHNNKAKPHRSNV